MKQQTLAMANGFERYTKKTRRTLFLEEMEQVVSWAELSASSVDNDFETFYITSGI